MTPDHPRGGPFVPGAPKLPCAFDALTMQHRGGALHFCEHRMSSRHPALGLLSKTLLHLAGCRRVGGGARTAGGAGRGALDLLMLLPTPPPLGNSMLVHCHVATCRCVRVVPWLRVDCGR